MTVIAAYLYRDGRRIRPVTIDEGIECARDKSEFVWIGVADPSVEEMQTLARTYDLHPLAVEDAIKANQLPKVDIYNDQLFVVARTAHVEDDAICYGETSIFLGKDHIITVRHGSARAHIMLRTELEAVPTRLAQGADYVAHAVLDFIVDGYLPIIEGIEEEVVSMEQTMLDHFLGREEVTRIFNLRRQLIHFSRILIPMHEVATKFVKLDLPCIDAEARPYFSDVRDHVRRVQTMVDDLREILNSVFESSNLLEQQRTGDITRQLAAWAAILAVPTAIAGIYGMNFDHMPELRTRFGYPVVIGVILFICTLLYSRFKKLKWL
ncbi:magnesium and cobalt transport protein CorA [Sphingobium sp. CCH11-B1]|jgi:magnesium transporter|uniref:magnesium and cobalt transport protein CorA n=1 Tax=Sphingobium sp. CCH11-B1 TaxID=1768781 RepID=UPI000831DD13|nr:magnesium and cobalt transport protein CorA [Sphingobium sp. CCH11-B1]MEA3387681.1 magnesium and cobalt transport protein CorA [Pseudomonadota bacterium]